MTNYRAILVTTAIALTGAVASANHHSDKADHDAKMDKKPAMTETMSMDKKRMMMKSMTTDEKRMMMKNMSLEEKNMLMGQLSMDEKAELMKGMSTEEKHKMKGKTVMDKDDMMERGLSEKQKDKVKDGMHPSKINDTVGEYLQDDAEGNRDRSRAIAVPGSNNTITTVTCPVGTTAQTNGTCLITGDYSPK